MGKFFRLWCILLGSLGVFSAHSQSIVYIYDQSSVGSLSSYTSHYYEPEGQLNVGEVMSLRRDFVLRSDANPNLGFHHGGVWLRLIVNNVSDAEDWMLSLNFSQLDTVDFYLVNGNDVIIQSHQGKLQSEQEYRVPTVTLPLTVASELEIFVRVESHSSAIIAPLSLNSVNKFRWLNQIDTLLWGLFYGGLLILAIYNSVLFIDVREYSLIAYVMYIVAVISWQFVWGGHIHLLYPQGLPLWIINHNELFFLMLGITSGIFSMTFLNTKKNAPTAHTLVFSFVLLQAITGVVCLFNVLPHQSESNLVHGLGMLAICTYIFAGFESYGNHFKPARYYIFAWTVLATGAITGMLSLVGAVPSNTFTTYCFQVAVFLESSLFSFALMDKSRSQLENEVEQATRELRHNMELIEEQNARLDIARKDAIKASNVKSQFLANMSHEIRTPLNAILGFSKELTQLALPTEKQEQVRIINGAADNLLTIVNDVLDFSKIEAGKLQINNQPFSPNQLFEETVTMMSKSAHMKRIEFVYELTPLPEKLIGDVLRIKQILNNLLGNALKFTSSGYIKLAVRGTPLPHGIHELEIRIEDTGIGISRKDQKKLFNAFSQIDGALNRSYQGTGLGLVICQELVRLMRGSVHLKSVESQGSVFTVILRTNQLSQRYSLSPTAEWIGKQVVLFDPNPDTRRAGAAILKHVGANVTCVESVAFLQTLTVEPDYLFAVMPVSHEHKRNDFLTELTAFPAKKRILWYSGPEPYLQFPGVIEFFQAQIRMPITPAKLDSIIHHKHQIENSLSNVKLNTLPQARILAVDDMEMNLKLLDAWLKETPVKLCLCTSGQDAVNRCQNQEFDLILMDIQMPGMDGLQACKQIRKTALNMGTPIIAVTAHAFKEEQERLLESGMDDYLPKPIEQNTLIDVVRRWCQINQPVDMALPSLDWQLALKRTSQNQNISRELLDDFLKMLPRTIETIKLDWEARNYEALKAEIHKLHGACCYTGVPKLQYLTDKVETALKLDQQFEVAEHLPALILEAEIISSQGDKLLLESLS